MLVEFKMWSREEKGRDSRVYGVATNNELKRRYHPAPHCSLASKFAAPSTGQPSERPSQNRLWLRCWAKARHGSAISVHVRYSRLYV